MITNTCISNSMINNISLCDWLLLIKLNRKFEELTETYATGWTLENVEINDNKYYIQMLGNWRDDPFDTQSSNSVMLCTSRRKCCYQLL
ncbi:unnamed protein product [Litomosoides sigmodontis]|uniref:Uncharacterized protein n=1 Tax=Litomosoides sigmodontis TaxID=42156 RepID=A0A3P6TFZ3_LITSI|nr:unnamed protein product [Litomosoides sigmodontis]